MRKLRFSQALLADGWRNNVVVSVDGAGQIADVSTDTEGADGQRIDGAAVPGMANVHSHAHQRAMAGLAETSGPGNDTFWTWRETMYRFANKIIPDDLEAIAAQLYVETLKAGYTSIGEFQYLHHAPDGRRYAEPAEMSLRCLAAAESSGIAITMLPTLYRFSGFGEKAASEGQRRFINDAEGFLRIVENIHGAIGKKPLVRLGIAPHSLRAVSPKLLDQALAEFDRLHPNSPIHMHVAEQAKEVEECVAFCEQRPVEFLLQRQALSPRWCLIHATHMSVRETEELARSGATVGLCPTTEANLGDGIFNGQQFAEAGGSFAIGSDSQISLSVAEELRQLEYSQRLKHGARNVLAGAPDSSTGRRLFEAAALAGAKAIAQPQGALAKGYRADVVVLDQDHPALIGRIGDKLLDSWIFSGGNGCVKDVFVGGRQLVKDRMHISEERITAAYRKAIGRLQN